MSGKVVGWAFEQHTGAAAAKLVLVKLADNANEQGFCWTSIDKLVEHSELGQSTVYKHMAALEEAALIRAVQAVHPEHGYAINGYQLAVPDEWQAIPPRGKSKGAIPPGGIQIPPHGKTIPPRGIHIDEPSFEPSSEPLAPQAAPETGDGLIPGLRVVPEPEAAKPPASTGTRWPSEQAVPLEWHMDAQAACRDHQFEVPDLRLEAGKFERYWASKSGKDATKVDWKKTFINWIIKAAEDAAKRGKTGNGRTAHENHRAGWAGLLDAEAGGQQGVPRPGQLALDAPKSG